MFVFCDRTRVLSEFRQHKEHINMSRKNVKFSNYVPLPYAAQQARHERLLRHAARNDIPLRDYAPHRLPRDSPYGGNLRYDTRSTTRLSYGRPRGMYPSGCYTGQGAYRRSRARGGRGRLERVLDQPGGREKLSRQFWANNPTGQQPWWAYPSPDEEMRSAVATVAQQNPAAAARLAESIAITYSSSVPSGDRQNRDNAEGNFDRGGTSVRRIDNVDDNPF